ncbi:hypothetical protein KFK09_018330 [Dendrobium nobile]|uniref:RRM domain-containing protein n=1 Tax=Dendrobium nobile TaxID=94219 RepID=A0A8T3AVJ3_DENNO|nr:hypothetical protein KFK09_018330 [Dendrobium nobile]
MKSGFAFVYMEDERDAEDAIRGLDRREFGKQGRRLRVEWTKQERGGRRSVSSRRSAANSRPSKTLFVINFDPINTRTRDLERHFEPYGKLVNVRIRRNFAFIQFETQGCNQSFGSYEHEVHISTSKLVDRVITVEYAVRDDDDNNNDDGRRNGHSPNRRGREYSSPDRRGRGRSASPYGRGLERDSPDYGRGPSPYKQPDPRSPKNDRAGSPVYERYRRFTLLTNSFSFECPITRKRGMIYDIGFLVPPTKEDCTFDSDALLSARKEPVWESVKYPDQKYKWQGVSIANNYILSSIVRMLVLQLKYLDGLSRQSGSLIGVWALGDGPAEIRASGDGLAEFRASGSDPKEVRASSGGFEEVWASGGCPAEVQASGGCPAKVRASGGSPAEVRASSSGLAEIQPSGVGLAEVQTSSDGLTEVWA